MFLSGGCQPTRSTMANDLEKSLCIAGILCAGGAHDLDVYKAAAHTLSHRSHVNRTVPSNFEPISLNHTYPSPKRIFSIFHTVKRVVLPLHYVVHRFIFIFRFSFGQNKLLFFFHRQNVSNENTNENKNTPLVWIVDERKTLVWFVARARITSVRRMERRRRRRGREKQTLTWNR